MKNYILLFVLLMTSGMMMGQLKVINTGATKIGNTGIDPALGSMLHVDGGNSVFTGGNVGIGINVPERLMHVATAENAAFLRFENTSGRFAGLELMTEKNMWQWSIRRSAQSFGLMLAYKPNDGAFVTNYLFFNPNGNTGIGTTSPNERLEVNGNVMADNISISSDKRLKSNVSPFSRGLKEIMRINPITYNYNGKANKNSKDLQIGMFAQELQEIAPELVSNFSYIEFNEEGDVLKEEEYLKINDTSIKYMLINAIKEQQKTIESLKKDLEEVTAQVEILNLALTNNNSDQLNNYQNHVIREAPALFQNEPNPFNTFTSISYVIPSNTTIGELRIFDISGRLVKSMLVDTSKLSGTIKIEADQIQNGIYSYSLIADGKVIDTKKMILAK